MPKTRKGKQDKPCDSYEVDMTGKTFGDCMCGHARAKHPQYGGKVEPDAKAEEPPPQEPEVIVRDGTHPCAKFELNMHNAGGYGACLCGFTRVDHEDFHADPQQWVNIRATLTPPKEFT